MDQKISSPIAHFSIWFLSSYQEVYIFIHYTCTLYLLYNMYVYVV